MIICRKCWCHNDPGATVCWNCRGSLTQPEAKAAKRPGRPPPPRTAEERLASVFVCPKGCSAPRSPRAAPAKPALARTLEVQQHRFAAVSCSHCGFTEIYDLDVLSGPDRAGPVGDASARD